MPDHLHLIVFVEDPKAAQERLAGTLGAYARRFGDRWHRVPEPAPIPDRKHLARQVRYVALNPCRSALCRDPLSWLWSTHRDVVGAVVDPWVTADRLADALGRPRGGFSARHHRYVSGDPSVAPGGTALPVPLPVRGDRDGVLRAAAMATQYVDPADRRSRRRAARAALALGRWMRLPVPVWRSLVDVSRSRAYEWAASVSAADLDAALRCLADPRLRDPVGVAATPTSPLQP